MTQALSTAPRAWPFRYEMIDGLRGLAALAVVAEHLGIAPLGHQAVMLFFVISGYCIAAAVESGRRRGLGLRGFMWRRLHRIYPPYFFALVFYVLTRVVKAAYGEGDDLLRRPWLDWVQNLTLTQWVTLPWHPVAQAAQNPKLVVAAFWSLNYEEQFYLVMALVLLLCTARRVPMWLAVVALSVAGLVWNCVAPGGWITGFFLEYWLHFSLGALLFYALCLSPGPAFRRTFLAAVTALGLFSVARILLAQPQELPGLRAYDEFIVVCGFTLFLYCMRPLSAAVGQSRLWRPVAALGTISYSLYLIHQFNLTLVTDIAHTLAPHAGQLVRLGLMLALEVALASAFWFFCERPFLNSTGRKAAPDQATQPIPIASHHGV